MKAGVTIARRLALRERRRVTARSDTCLRLLRQALLPGPNGTVADSRTQASLHEYWALRATTSCRPGAEVSAARRSMLARWT
jgi:hypothetical protein